MIISDSSCKHFKILTLLTKLQYLDQDFRVFQTIEILFSKKIFLNMEVRLLDPFLLLPNSFMLLVSYCSHFSWFQDLTDVL